MKFLGFFRIESENREIFYRDLGKKKNEKNWVN